MKKILYAVFSGVLAVAIGLCAILVKNSLPLQPNNPGALQSFSYSYYNEESWVEYTSVGNNLLCSQTTIKPDSQSSLHRVAEMPADALQSIASFVEKNNFRRWSSLFSSPFARGIEAYCYITLQYEKTTQKITFPRQIPHNFVPINNEFQSLLASYGTANLSAISPDKTFEFASFTMENGAIFSVHTDREEITYGNGIYYLVAPLSPQRTEADIFVQELITFYNTHKESFPATGDTSFATITSYSSEIHHESFYGFIYSLIADPAQHPEEYASLNAKATAMAEKMTEGMFLPVTS